MPFGSVPAPRCGMLLHSSSQDSACQKCPWNPVTPYPAMSGIQLIESPLDMPDHDVLLLTRSDSDLVSASSKQLDTSQQICFILAVPWKKIWYWPDPPPPLSFLDPG